MKDEAHRWVIVLAAGDGTRMRSLTSRLTGQPVPKQFCTLWGRRSMLQETLERAQRLAPPERVLTMVAAQHRLWWEGELKAHPPANVIVQPLNRGTASGVLLPVLLIHARDPEAEVVVMPSDHFVERSDVLDAALEHALSAARARRHGIVLLGMTPEEADPDYGWILPAASAESGTLKKVQAFVEKPDTDGARDLMRQGALLNTFVLAARSRALLRLYRQLPDLLTAFGDIVAGSTVGTLDDGALTRLYADLPVVDFSRALLQAAGQELWVLPVPACGWTDLGTPERFMACLGHTRVASYDELSCYLEML